MYSSSNLTVESYFDGILGVISIGICIAFWVGLMGFIIPSLKPLRGINSLFKGFKGILVGQKWLNFGIFKGIYPQEGIVIQKEVENEIKWNA